MNRSENETSSGAKDPQAFLNFPPNFAGCSERQGALGIHAAAPENKPVAVLMLEFRRIHAGG